MKLCAYELCVSESHIVGILTVVVGFFFWCGKVREKTI